MSELSPRPSRFARAFEALARLQIEHTGRFLIVAAVVALASLTLASRLELRLRFEQLLPQGRPSVVALERLQKNVPAGSRLFVIAEGGSSAAQRAFADALVARLRALSPSWLADVSDGVGEARVFLEPRAGLFLELEDLQQLHDDVEARWSWEVARETGANLDDDPPPELSAKRLEGRLRARFGSADLERFPGGYFAAKDGSAQVVAVAASVGAGELERMREVLEVVQREATTLAHGQRELRLSYAGDLVTGLAEYGAVVADLLQVGMLGVGLVVTVLFLYFWRVRALVSLSLALAIGLSVTFGLTKLTVGHLNVATGFLASVVAGNGINFGILYLARYFEERRNGRDPRAAVEIAHAQTWPGTMAAALAAAAAYGSLGISEFGAFRDFAAIGAMGMIVCLLTSHLVLPPLVLALERLKQALPQRWSLQSSERRSAAAGRFSGLSLSEPLLRLVSRAPLAVSFVGVGLALLGAVALVPYVLRDPLEYDMRQMQNNVGTGAEMYRASKIAADILGAKLDSSMVLLADKPEQVPELKRALEARRDRAVDGLKPFEAVHTAFDFVPSEQPRKLELLQQLRERLLKARRRGFVNDADFARIEPYLPPADLRPWSLADLPGSIARPFTDRAGVIGRLALIEPTAGESDANVEYLMRWADSFRSVTLASGETLYGSGRAVIFADILATVLSDIPRTVVVAFALTLATVLVAFRRGFYALIVIGSLLVGLGWVALAMSLFDLKINFFNFVALPVSFGIGVDYAVNLVQRYAAEPERGPLAALRSTGGAVVLCSLTTIVGYLALLVSVNQAIRSLGVLAVLGELGCLAAATLVLPALLLLRERRQLARRRLVPELAGAGPVDPAIG